MKSLKLDHNLALAVVAGEKAATWRLFDDKDIRVNDTVALIDKVDPRDKNTWRVIGEGFIDQVIEKRLRDITDADYVGHDRDNSFEEMITTYQGYYPEQKVTPDTAVKILHFTFHKYTERMHESNEQQQIQTDVNKSTKKVKLYADGGSRGNPGPSASGYVLLDEHDALIMQNGVYLGVTTNNQAEYQALKLGLESALKLGAREVVVYMDSMLVVNQMKGIFKVKNRDLWPIHDSVKELLTKFTGVSFTHVPRELNKQADSEVNKILDTHLKGREIAAEA